MGISEVWGVGVGGRNTARKYKQIQRPRVGVGVGKVNARANGLLMALQLGPDDTPPPSRVC